MVFTWNLRNSIIYIIYIESPSNTIIMKENTFHLYSPVNLGLEYNLPLHHQLYHNGSISNCFVEKIDNNKAFQPNFSIYLTKFSHNLTKCGGKFKWKNV